MARYALATVLLALAAGASATTWAEFGMDMGSTAYEAVCWYEKLKVFPKTDSKGFTQCYTQSEQMKTQILEKVKDEPSQKKYFGQWMDSPMSALPSEYKSKCSKHLKSAAAETSDNESDALNDEGQEYPFRAFAYCMMKTLRAKHGDKAIEAVKNERTHSKKHWMMTLLDRENEFRARHGSQPLSRDSELTTRAQRWSEQSAANCDDDHIKDTHPDYMYRGKSTGESLGASTSSKENRDVDAYGAVNGWYEEIDFYPFPGGIKDGHDPRFHSVGHFTQTVWAGSQRVGYGYAFNPNCPGSKIFITARYWPAGNAAGGFQDNVKPPQN